MHNTCTYAYKYTHECIYTHMHNTVPCTYAYTYTHTNIYIYIYIRIDIYIYTCFRSLFCLDLLGASAWLSETFRNFVYTIRCLAPAFSEGMYHHPMGAAMGCPQQFPQHIPQQNPQQIPQQFATPQPMGDPLSASMAQMAAQQFAMYPPPGGGQAHAPVTPMPPLMQQQSQMTQPPKPRVPVTTAGIPIFKMPKKHSVAIIEHIEPSLDSVIFGPVGPKELSMVIWLLTRVNPSTNIHEFHVEYYDDLPAKFKKKR